MYNLENKLPKGRSTYFETLCLTRVTFSDRYNVYYELIFTTLGKLDVGVTSIQVYWCKQTIYGRSHVLVVVIVRSLEKEKKKSTEKICLDNIHTKVFPSRSHHVSSSSSRRFE